MSAEEIVKAREQLGLSQMGLADRAGISLRTIERIESGKVAQPNPATIAVIKVALDNEREAASV